MGRLVPVTPAEPGELAGSHAGERGEMQRRVKSQVSSGGENWASWSAVQHSGPLRWRRRERGGCAPSAGSTPTRCWRTAWVKAERITTGTS